MLWFLAEAAGYADKDKADLAQGLVVVYVDGMRDRIFGYVESTDDEVTSFRVVRRSNADADVVEEDFLLHVMTARVFAARYADLKEVR